MKNLKKLSRNELKSMVGGKRFKEGLEGNCPDMCTPNGGGGGDDRCARYGLTCGFFQCGPNSWGNRCQ